MTPIQLMGRRLAKTLFPSLGRHALPGQPALAPHSGEAQEAPPAENGGAASGSPALARRMLAVGCVLVAMVMVVVDGAAANVALPTIAESLGVTPAMTVRVVTAYQCALLMALLPCAALGESLGMRRVFGGGVLLYAAAAALCAVSPTLDWLVAARFLQGLGAAAVMALGVALLRAALPPRQLGAAIAWNALAVALSSAAGPAIGAAVLSATGWNRLFAITIPLALLVMASARALPGVAASGRTVDWHAILLNAAAFGLLVFAAQLLLASPALAATMLVIAVLAFLVLVRREMPKTAPLIPLDLLRISLFRTSAVASVLCFAGQTAAMIALPFHLKHGLAQDGYLLGLWMMPWPLAVAAAAPLAARLAERLPTTWICTAGGMCLAAGLGVAALLPPGGGPALMLPFMLLCGAGFGLFNVANNRNLFLSAPKERSGAAGGMQGTARLCGQTAGALVMSLLYTVAPADAAPRIGLAAGAVLTLAAAIVSLRGGRRRHCA